jgi:hypothetical protein
MVEYAMKLSRRKSFVKNKEFSAERKNVETLYVCKYSTSKFAVL